MRKLFSHHEIALLLVLLGGPVQIALADPDVQSLRQDSLVESVSQMSESGVSGVQLTEEGYLVSRKLAGKRL